MLLVRVRSAEDVAFVMALLAMFLPVLALLFLPVTALAAAEPRLRVTLVIAAPAAAVSTVAPMLFAALPLGLRSAAGACAAFLSSTACCSA